jgi:hypothetical protein
VDAEEVQRKRQECERRLASLTPERNLRSAALLCEVMPTLNVRQRRVAEDMIQRFEARARVQSAFS